MHITRALQRHLSSVGPQTFGKLQADMVNRWYIAMRIASIYAYSSKGGDLKKEHEAQAKILGDVMRVSPEEFLDKTPEQLLILARHIRACLDHELDVESAAQSEAQKKREVQKNQIDDWTLF